MSKTQVNTTNFVYEFNYTIKINDNILVTRDFNVKNYNDKFRESLEAMELMKDLMAGGNAGTLGIIPDYFVKKSIDDLWDKYESGSDNPHFGAKRKDVLVFEINKRAFGDNRETILATKFDADVLQQIVKKSIDLKPILKDVTSLIKEAMSKNSYTLTYGKTRLNRLNKISKREIEAIYERQ